ncbi:ankyrin repeat domain-containing protein 31 [Parasteatoda tepidariorum]|uniref:ankyrin repeat domain-containing protein 31 n=1 Tax=Parasteatoda tepidariorum TaxID=114398 RepID=UPI0039BC8136
MEKSDVKIPKFVIQRVATELKHFIEDRDTAFKFHPWQTSSVLGKFQKTIHLGLPERAIHHLHDTGAATEILRFAKNVESCEKIRKVTSHLFGLLGINISNVSRKNKTFTLGNQKQRISCNAYEDDNPRDTNKLRIFEVQKLVESVAQELINLFSSTTDHNTSTLYSYKLGKFYIEGAKKQQKLARCTSTACLFRNKENILKNDYNRKTKRRISNLRTHRNNQGRSFQINTFKRKRSARETSYRISNAPKKSHPVKLKNSKQFFKRCLVEAATQTNSWRGVSNEFEKETDDESFELEDSSTLDSDIYCKSDTLNDASMITEEIASEFVVATPRHTSRRSSRKPSASKSPDIGHRVVQFLNKKAKEAPENKQPIPAKQVSVSISKSKSHKMSEEKSKNIATVSNSAHQNSNSKSNVGASPTATKLSPVNARNVLSAKSIAKYVANSAKTSKTNISSKSPTPSVVFHPPEDKPQEISKSKSQNNKVQESTQHVETVEKHEEVNPDVPEKSTIERSKVPLQALHSFPTSSENETTIIPMDSLSSSSESLASSFKENDNTSPEYSSHWTEEELSSDTESELDMDNSFREKFRAYKESLLEEDDGIVASCEDEMSHTGSLRKEMFSNESREENLSDYNGLLRTLETDDFQTFQNMINQNKNLLSFANKDGYNLLHLSASKGLQDFLLFLLNVGIPVGGATKKGFTALHLAIFNGHSRCCNVLLQSGAQLINENGKFDKRIFSINGKIPDPMKALLQQYDENLNKVQKLCDIFRRIGSKKKKTSKAIPQTILSALADLTFDEDE